MSVLLRKLTLTVHVIASVGRIGTLAVVASVLAMPAVAHDPVFAPGPHTLFKGGVEIHLGTERAQTEGDVDKAAELRLLYGLTGDWVAGVLVPYAYGGSDDGLGATTLLTKYRFWRNDQPRVQESAALLARLTLDSGEHRSGATDALLGLTYGYESLKWYRWISARYRYNGETDAGVDRGDVLFLDAAIGVRPRRLEYREPDSVWMLELNFEQQERARAAGAAVPNSGGSRLFLSPGLMWTWRNVAVKPGIQIPVWSDLEGAQSNLDYLALVEIEAHL